MIHIGAAELGPRKAKVGAKMTASYSRYAEEYEYDGKRWVLKRTWRDTGGLGGEWTDV